MQAIIRFAWPYAAPLLDGHRDAQNRTANAALTWLRAVCVEVVDSEPLNWRPPISATEIAQMCRDQDIGIPGVSVDSDLDTAKRRVGALMGNLLKSSNAVDVDNYTVSKTKIQREREDGNGLRDINVYHFEKTKI
jgi:hypothetical protein